MPSCNIWSIVAIFCQPHLLFFTINWTGYFLHLSKASPCLPFCWWQSVWVQRPWHHLSKSAGPISSPLLSLQHLLSLGLLWICLSHLHPRKESISKTALQKGLIFLYVQYTLNDCIINLPLAVYWGPGQVHLSWCGRDEEASILPHD